MTHWFRERERERETSYIPIIPQVQAAKQARGGNGEDVPDKYVVLLDGVRSKKLTRRPTHRVPVGTTTARRCQTTAKSHAAPRRPNQSHECSSCRHRCSSAHGWWTGPRRVGWSTQSSCVPRRSPPCPQRPGPRPGECGVGARTTGVSAAGAVFVFVRLVFTRFRFVHVPGQTSETRRALGKTACRRAPRNGPLPFPLQAPAPWLPPACSPSSRIGR